MGFLATLTNETVTDFNTNKHCGSSTKYTVKYYSPENGLPSNNVKVCKTLGGFRRFTQDTVIYHTSANDLSVKKHKMSNEVQRKKEN